MPTQFNVVAEMLLKVNPSNIAKLRSQISQSLSNINVGINVSANASSSLKNLNANLNNINSSLRTVQRGFKELASAVSSVKTLTVNTQSATTATQRLGQSLLAYGAASVGIHAIAGAIKNAAKEGADFERTMVKLTQQGATAGEIDRVTRAVTKLSTTYGVSSKDLAEVAVTFQQAGLAMKDVEKATAAIAKASLSPNFGSISQAVEGSLASMRVFNIEAKDLEKTLTSIDSVSGAYAAESKDLITTIQKAGAAFKTTGGDLNELLGIFTSIRATTRESPDQIATGLRTIFSRLSRPQTIESLRLMGIELRHTKEEAEALGDSSLAGKIVGNFDKIRRIASATAGLSGTDTRFMGIVEAMGGYRQVSRVVPMLQQLSVAEEAANVARYGGLKISNQAAIAAGTLTQRLAALHEQWLAFGRDVMASNAFRTLTDGALKLANAITQIGSVLAPVIPLLGGFAAYKGVSAVGGKMGFSLPSMSPKMFAGGLGLGATSIIASQFTPNVHDAVEQGRTGSYRAGSIISGTAGYTALGSVAGPYGAAAGALYGLVTSIRESSDEIRKAELGQSIQKFSQSLKNLLSGNEGLRFKSIDSQLSEIPAIQRKNRDEALKVATGFFGGFDNKTYNEQSELLFQKSFGSQLPGMVQFLNAQAESLGKGGRNFSSFRSGNRGLNESYLRIIGQNNGMSIEEVLKDFQKVFEASKLAKRNEDALQAGGAAEQRQLASFRQLSLAAEQTAFSLTRLKGSASVSESLFSGQMAATPIAGGIGAGIHFVGGPNQQLFRQSLKAITSPFGRLGGEMFRSGESLDQVMRLLPGAISVGMRSGPLEDEELPQRILDNVVERLGGPKRLEQSPQLRGVIESVKSQLLPMKSEDIMRSVSSGDVTGLVNKISENARSEFTSNAERISKSLTEEANAFVSALHKSAEMTRAIGEQQFRADQSQLALTLKENEIKASVLGLRHGAGDLVSLETLQRPFLNRQMRLTGMGGVSAMSPGTISDALTKAKGDLQTAIAVRDEQAKNLGSPTEFAAQKVADMARRVSDLNSALEHLTHTSESTAAAQHKLSQLEQDREGRLGFGRHFLGQDAGGRLQTTQGLKLLAVARSRGDTLAGMSIPQQQLALSTLGTLGNARIASLGGIRGRDLEERLIGNTVPGVKFDRKEQTEYDKLQGVIVDGFKAAHQAEVELQRQKVSDQKAFVSDWKQVLSEFKSQLKETNTTTQLSHLQSEKVRIEAQQKRISPQLTNKQSLAGYGLTDAEIGVYKQPETMSLLEGLEHEASKARSAVGPINHDSVNQVVDEILRKSPSGVRSGFHAVLDREGKRNFLGLMDTFGINDERERNAVFADFASQLSPQARAGRTSAQQRTAIVSSLEHAIAGHGLRSAGRIRANAEQDFIQQLPAGQRDFLRNQFFARGKGQEFISALQGHDPAGFAKVKAQANQLANALKSVNERIKALSPASPKLSDRRTLGFADGGSVGPKGSDTVPAYLTPGEFVVRRDVAQKNLSLLESLNSGVSHFAEGGTVNRRLSPIGQYFAQMERLRREQVRLYGLNRFRSRFDLLHDELDAANAGLNRRFGKEKPDENSPEWKRFINAEKRLSTPRTYRPWRPVGNATSLDQIRRRERAAGGNINLTDIAVDEQIAALRERRRAQLAAAGNHHRRRFGVPVAAAISLDEIRRRPSLPPVVPAGRDVITVGSKPREFPITGTPKHFADGGFVDSIGQHSKSLDRFHQGMTAWSGHTQALTKALEAMPREISFAGTHNHVHIHHGIDLVGDRVAKAMESLVEDKMQAVVVSALRRALPQAGII